MNARARGGTARRRLNALLRRAPGLASRMQILELGDAVDVIRTLERAPAGAVPIAAGGDGTVNTVARALFATCPAPRVMGVLPLGTGNAFAHAHGVGRAGAALAALARGGSHPADLMLTTHPTTPVAVASISAGFEAAVIRDITHAPGTGIVSGTRGLLRNLGFTGADVGLHLDDELVAARDRPVFNAGLYVIPCYAFGWNVLGTSPPRAGRGAAAVHGSRGAYLRFLARPLPGRHGRAAAASDVRPWRTARLTADSGFQVDGEAIEGGTMEVRIAPGALRVLTPAETPDPAALC